MPRRMDRVNVLLRDEISRVLATELKDPRLPVVVSVTHVSASRDTRSARVFVSVMGDEDEKANALKALKSAAGFVHRQLRKKLSLKNLPAIEFRLDESIQRGAEMQSLISDVAPPPEDDQSDEPGDGR